MITYSEVGNAIEDRANLCPARSTGEKSRFHSLTGNMAVETAGLGAKAQRIIPLHWITFRNPQLNPQ